MWARVGSQQRSPHDERPTLEPLVQAACGAENDRTWRHSRTVVGGQSHSALRVP